MNIAFSLLALSPTVITCIVVAAVVVCAVVVGSIIVTHNKHSSKKSKSDKSTQNLMPVNSNESAAADAAKPQSDEKQEDGRADIIEKMSGEIDDVHEEINKLAKELDDADLFTINARNLSEEVIEEPVEEVIEEPVEEVVEEPVAEVIEEPVEEVVEEPVAEVVEELVEEVVEEPIAEVVEEPVAVVEPVVEQVVEQPVVMQEAPRVAPEGKVLIRVRYNRSYTAKIIQSDDVVKGYYEELKNEIMRYKVSERTSWRYETFRKGRKLLIKMAIRGKTLCLYFALNPADYEGTKYKVQDVSAIASKAEVPVLYKIKNARRCKYAKDLIATVMAANELTAGEEQNVDYKSQYPYEELEPLIERRLVKLLTWSEEVSGSEVGLIAVPVEQVTEEIAAAAEQLPEEVEQVVEAPRVAPEGKVLIRVRYNRSYTAKIIQSDDVVKGYYEELKNEIMRYKVSERTSWRYETFRKGRKLLIKMAIRGKTLCLYFALNPADYEGTKYKVQDVSAIASKAEVPVLYKIKNARRCKYAKDLIATVMAANELTAGEEQNVDYKSQYPYEELEPLIERRLVKLLTWSEEVSGSEVGVIAVHAERVTGEIAAAAEQLPEEIEIIEDDEPIAPIFDEDDEIEDSVKNFFNEDEDDEEETQDEQDEDEPADVNLSINVAEADEILDDEFVEAFVHQVAKNSDKSKKAVVNIDTLGRYFSSGETVNLEQLKKRVPSIAKNVTYIKVLARGTLDKALTVEADDFSPQAIKMIVLTGGKVVRFKRT